MSESIEPVFVPTALGRIAVHVLGAGRPTVLWHSMFVDGSSWGFLLPALLPGRRLLAATRPALVRSLVAISSPPQHRPDGALLHPQPCRREFWASLETPD